MTNPDDIFDKETGMMTLNDHTVSTEFEIATHDAIVNNEIDFEFYGHLVSTSDAINVVQAITAQRTYH